MGSSPTSGDAPFHSFPSFDLPMPFMDVCNVTRVRKQSGPTYSPGFMQATMYKRSVVRRMAAVHSRRSHVVREARVGMCLH